MHTSNVDTEQIMAIIKDKIQHTYLDKYIIEPKIDEEKLTILSMIVNNTTLPLIKKKQYVVTTMLVQIALDTHDLVPITNKLNESKSNRTQKQLTVLAGDYFSGLYYLLLSEIEDFDMIHVLASAIKEINEYKMKLYYKEVDSFQKYTDMLKKIESILIVRVAEHVNNTTINSIVGDLIITAKLINEKRGFYNKDCTPILNNWLEYSSKSNATSVLNKMEILIKENTNRIETYLIKNPIHLSGFKTYIDYLLNEFMYSNASVAEEG